MTVEPAAEAVPAPDEVALREPAHRVSPRAVSYWRTGGIIGAVVELVIAGIAFALVPSWPWWATVLVVVGVVANLVYVLVVPTLRYRVHRWEVSPNAIHTRSGWLTIETRIAPLNRVQTVDSRQGALMRPFRLASLTVTTASAAGPITIEGLDADQARDLVATLTAITGASEGDAT